MKKISLFKNVCDFRMADGVKRLGGPDPETPWEYWIFMAIEEAADLHNYLQIATEHKFDPVKERHFHIMIGYTLVFLQPIVETIGIVLVGIFNRGDPETIQQILKEANYDEREEEDVNRKDVHP